LIFLKNSFIAVFDDVKGSGGYSLERDISSTSENTLVSDSHLAPKGKGTAVMTHPFHRVKITKNDLPVIFN